MVIPVYNRTGLLKSAIESVLLQRYEHCEIIVVDDGSAEETFKAVTPYLNRVNYIKLEKNCGVSHARNVGISIARFDYIALLDSDDVWLPNKLILQTDFMKNRNLLISHTDEFWYKNGRFINEKSRYSRYGGYIFKESLDFCRISPSSVIIHKSIFDTVGYFNESLPVAEDYDLWLRVTRRFEVGYLDVKTIVKIAHDHGQLSKDTQFMEYYRLYSLLKLINSKKLDYYQKKYAIIELGRKFRIVSEGVNKKNKKLLTNISSYNNFK